jgi:hypothetical protein
LAACGGGSGSSNRTGTRNGSSSSSSSSGGGGSSSSSSSGRWQLTGSGSSNGSGSNGIRSVCADNTNAQLSQRAPQPARAQMTTRSIQLTWNDGGFWENELGERCDEYGRPTRPRGTRAGKNNTWYQQRTDSAWDKKYSWDNWRGSQVCSIQVGFALKSTIVVNCGLH